MIEIYPLFMQHIQSINCHLSFKTSRDYRVFQSTYRHRKDKLLMLEMDLKKYKENETVKYNDN